VHTKTLTVFGVDPDYQAEVMCDTIWDWREQIVGGLLHIQNLDYLYLVLDVFQKVAEATDTDEALQAMLDAAKLLGRTWGRLYLLDENDPNRFIGRMSFGIQNAELERQFNVGHFSLIKEILEDAGWLSINKGIPMVFCWDDSREDREEFFTPQGLPAINVRNDQEGPLKKEPGDFWLDFPLMTERKLLGKLHLQCDEDLPPEDFELLKVLSRMTTGLLDAFARRDDAFRKRESWIQEAAERTMAVTAHNIATHFASLPVLLTRYRLSEIECKCLEAINNDFAHILDGTLATIKRTKELLANVNVRPSRFDIVLQFQRTLQSALPNEAWTLRREESLLEVVMDVHLLENALLEMIQNTRDATINLEQMHIEVSIQLVHHNSQELVRLVYRDNGPGIPPHFKERIFGNFFSSRPGRKQGTGLGLGFVRRVVGAHGGTIRECGHPGQGAKFVIEIPRFMKYIETKE
jgi:hypothetical protein